MTSTLRASRIPAAALAVIASLLPAWSVFAGPVVIPTATAPSPSGQGQGLCLASAVSMNPATDFPQMAALFNPGINAFLDANVAGWVQGVQATIFDLSNGQDTGSSKVSWGDFTSSMAPACPSGGCPFPWNDATTAFASRFRGYLNVTSSLAGASLHVGIYADDAASLTVFDATGTPHAVLTQPPVLGAPTWRVTEAVTFGQPGLYPVEILYTQIVQHAALEVSFFQGSFQDLQQPADQVPVTSLATAGFTLFAVTSFFQTESGAPSFSDPTRCQQCVRGAGSAGCPAGMTCNAAALCAPCDVDAACGASCSPCASPTPHCVSEGSGFACGACRTSADCGGCACDPTTHACASCGGPDGGGAGGAGGATTGSGGSRPDGGGAGGAGGATTGSGGGRPDAGPSTGTGGSAPTSPGSRGTCGCRAAADPPSVPGISAAAVVIAVAARRRGRRRPTRPASA